MILVRQRQDLLDEGLEIPVKIFGSDRTHARIDQWLYACQPDDLDDCEYSVLLLNKSYEVIGVAISIDLDYKGIS